MIDDQGIFAFLWDINDTHCVYNTCYEGIDGQNLVLVDLSKNTKQTIDNTSGFIWETKLGSNQLAYCITPDFGITMGDLYGYDLATQARYKIRSQGSTFWEFSMNKSTDQLIMCSIGSGNNPNEWDVSMVKLP